MFKDKEEVYRSYLEQRKEAEKEEGIELEEADFDWSLE